MLLLSRSRCGNKDKDGFEEIPCGQESSCGKQIQFQIPSSTIPSFSFYFCILGISSWWKKSSLDCYNLQSLPSLASLERNGLATPIWSHVLQMLPLFSFLSHNLLSFFLLFYIAMFCFYLRQSIALLPGVFVTRAEAAFLYMVINLSLSHSSTVSLFYFCNK